MINKNSEKKKVIVEAYRASLMQRQVDFDPDNKNKRYDFADIQQQIHEDDYNINTKAIGKKYGSSDDMEEILEKQSPSMWVFWWQQRFCSLKKNVFIYYEGDNKNSDIAGILNFNAVSVDILFTYDDTKKVTSFKLTPRQSQKEFIFRGRTPQQTEKWAKSLSKAIETSMGKKMLLTYICHYQRFWRKDYFMESEFREEAQSGDIVLFRGTKKNAVFQRKLTRDEFDHVAVVLKNSRGDILLFEATGGVGVGMFPWNRMIQRQWYKDQDLIVHRSLEVERNNQFLTELQKFVNENMGKKYQFSLQKMMKRQSINDPNAAEKQKTYFCSELVASLYKKLQMLPKQLSAGQYWPGTFAEVENLKLIKGKYGTAKLGPERIIIFEEALIKKK